jgi:hypothetical protein
MENKKIKFRFGNTLFAFQQIFRDRELFNNRRAAKICDINKLICQSDTTKILCVYCELWATCFGF